MSKMVNNYQKWSKWSKMVKNIQNGNTGQNKPKMVKNAKCIQSSTEACR